MDFNNVSDMFRAMNEYGASILKTTWTSEDDPDSDRMVVVVQGREEIEDISTAIEAVEEKWGEELDG